MNYRNKAKEYDRLAEKAENVKNFVIAKHYRRLAKRHRKLAKEQDNGKH